jgi:hypothetical protein
MTSPRVVLVTRPTPYELVLARYGTEGQARFVLAGRGEDVDALRRDHHAFHAALHAVLATIPLAWRRTRIDRDDLDRFLFEPVDILVVVGQDGLVANVARYLSGQPVIGVDPAPGRNPGVLVRHRTEAVPRLLDACASDQPTVEARTLVEVRFADGQRILGLNEVFLGHRTHQSARYRLQGRPQSSSGLVVSTGTGATGWAASIHRSRATDLVLPTPEERRLAWFVREAWPGPGLDATSTEGSVDEGQLLEITSEMDQQGVVFSDGVERDALGFDRGRIARIGVAPERLHLVV